MKLVTAIVRPEKVMNVIKALEEEGYFASVSYTHLTLPTT